MLPIVGSWHVNLVLFFFDGGQVPTSTVLSGLKVHVLNKILWPFTASARTTRSKPFLAKPKFQKLQLGKEKHKVHHVLNKMLWPFATSASDAVPFWLQFLSSDREGVIHSPACFSVKTYKLSRSHSCRIDLCRQGLRSCHLLRCWLPSKVTGVAYEWTCMRQLRLPKLVKVT